MQANKLVAFKNVQSNNVQAIINGNANMYMYINTHVIGNQDCLVFNIVGTAQGYNVSYYGYANGATIYTHNTTILKGNTIALYITSIVNKYA